MDLESMQGRKDTSRARVGIIIPSSNRIVEQELVPMFPSGIGVNIARLRMAGIPPSALLPAISSAAESLCDAGCGVIVFQCTASSMEEGAAVNARILEAIRKATGRIAVTTASAIAHAVEVLRIKDLALLTPYSEAVTRRQRSYLEEIGLRIVNCEYKNVSTAPNFFFLPQEYWLQELMRLATPQAQGYLLSCANLSCLSLIDRAEKQLARPVLTSNQAILWDSLRQAGIDDTLEDIGQLGRMPRARGEQRTTGAAAAVG
jgi:maleate isomerase